MPSSQFAVGLVLLLWIITTVSAALDFPVTIGETAFSLRMEVYGEASIRATLLPLTGWSYTVDHVIVAKPADGLLRRVGKDSACVKDYCLRVIRDEASIELVYIRHGTPLTHAVVKDVTSPNIRAVFPRALTLYGLPEHAADLPLRQDHTYELYNTDAFQYPLNKTSALYGAIPFVMAYATNQSTGLLWLNSAEMNVRIESGQLPSCDWKAEVGPVDLFFIPGPTPAEVQRNHAQLTGPTMLPPYFSLGYHQCRWNYMSTQDCHGVDESMDEGGFPYDVLWLDIEHTDKKKYFTWDTYNFPNVTELTSFLSAKGRKLVTIKDPHVKRDGSYALHIEATQHGHYIKDSKGGDFTGDCWPGASSWPDFFNRRTREWYSRWFHDDKYPGGSRDIHTWVDMNEPSVFRGAKGTMDKAAMHELDDGHVVEHRQVHNMYGHMNLIAADKGMREAGGEDAQPERPFILTRSFFPGSQRLAAMWTGDNAGRWDHLDLTSAELLSLSISNYPFCGCDVGGFFHDPEEELFVRWMQAGAFYPFFRAHAHIDTRRREPFRFSPDGQRVMRDALALRYALIPYLYTVFYDAHRFGNTILRPLFFEFPEQEALREEQRTYMFGPSVLVRPVMEKGAKEVSVVLPAKTQWYRYPSGEAVSGASYTMPVDMSTIPVFFRGGHIIPMKLRLRRSTLAARFDPFTLYVCLDAEGRGAGELYVDDGTTFDHEQGSFAFRSFTFADGKLRSSIHKDAHGSIFSLKNEVERIIILGLPQHRHVLSVHVMSTRDGFAVGDSLPFVRNSLMVEVLINTPLCVADDFTLHFEFAV